MAFVASTFDVDNKMLQLSFSASFLHFPCFFVRTVNDRLFSTFTDVIAFEKKYKKERYGKGNISCYVLEGFVNVLVPCDND
jgi:hypothetical protein